MCVLFAATLVGYWVQRPSSERLYALGTGDTSRIHDERLQQVLGKAANTTLCIFAGVLILGGLVYETLVLGVWPILTAAEFVTLLVIWTIATSYWNRRL